MKKSLSPSLEEVYQADVAWKRSFTRRGMAAGLIYITIFLVFSGLEISNPATNALAPTIGFLIGTSPLLVAKKWWLKHLYHRKK